MHDLYIILIEKVFNYTKLLRILKIVERVILEVCH